MEINSLKQLDSIINDGAKHIVDFYATWCGPCKQLGKVLETLSKEELNGYDILKVDVDKNEDIAVKYDIRNIPFVFLCNNKKIGMHFVGARGKQEIINILKQE